MNDGMQTLLDLPSNIRQRIVEQYGGLEEFYFEVFYNEYQKYHAHKARNENLMSQLESELLDIEDFLEESGLIDARAITTSISSDYSEIIATRATDRLLTEAGMSQDDIKEFIKNHLDKE